MSAGPGHVMRTIMATIAANPRQAFTVDDLCDRAFPGANRIEKKHRVAVIRALDGIATRCDLDGGWARGRGWAGRPRLVVFQRCNRAAAVRHLESRNIWLAGDWAVLDRIRDQYGEVSRPL
jgi:hypothetical protein